MKEEESVGLSLTYLTSAVRVGRRPGGGGRGSRGGGGGEVVVHEAESCVTGTQPRLGPVLSRLGPLRHGRST